MSLAESFLLPEFDREMDGVRKVLERAPEEKYEWRPHEKSGTMGWLVSHLATLPRLAVNAVELESYEIAPGGQPPPGPPKMKTREEALKTFDEMRGKARAAIASVSDENLMKPWSLLFQGKTIYRLPRIHVLQGLFLNHTVHHRAQLSVYLRLNDIAVPGLYGPSADEPFPS